MADNVTLNSGSGGDTIAADDVGGVKYQVVKLAVGADGSASLVANANPIPISDAGGSLTVDGTVAVTGVATAANQSTANGLLTTIDADTGAISTAAAAIQAAVEGTLVVDLGANNDVTVTGTVTADTELPAAAALADNAANPTAPAVGAFGMVWDGATWDRLPGTSADGVTVNLGGNNDVTVTGTVTANLSATDNAVLDTIDTSTAAAAVSLAVLDDWDEADRCKTNPIVGQAGIQGGAGTVSANTVRVALATDVELPAGTNTIGTVQAAGIAAHGAAVAGNPVLVGVEARTTDGTAVDSGDVVRPMADAQGKLVTVPGALHTRYVSGVTNITDTASDDLVAAAASTRTVVTGISVTNKDATVGTTVSIRDGTTAKVTAYAAPEGGGFVIAPGAPIFVGTANTAITAICGTDSSDCDITVWGYQIPG